MLVNRGNPQVIALTHVPLVAMIMCLQDYSLCCFVEFHTDSLHFWFYIWLSILHDCSLKGNLTWSMSVTVMKIYMVFEMDVTLFITVQQMIMESTVVPLLTVSE